MPTTFVFVRHAEGTHNVAAVIEGPSAYNDPLHEDALITERGVHQALQARTLLEDSQISYDAIYCSPSRRCRQTLGHAYPMGLFQPVHIDDRLLEPQGYHICNKRAEYDSIKHACPTQWNLFQLAKKNPYDDGHTDTAFRRRIFEFTAEVVASYPDSTVLLVGHHEWIRTWFDIFYQREVRLPNCGIIRGTITLEELCVIPLQADEPTVEFLHTVLRDVRRLPDDIRMRVLLTGLQRIHDDASVDHATRVNAALKKLFLVQSDSSWDSLAGFFWKDIHVLLRAYSAMKNELYSLTDDERGLLVKANADLNRWFLQTNPESVAFEYAGSSDT